MKTSPLTGKKIAFYTLGCKLNFSETSTLSRRASEFGLLQVSFEEDADVYVINTCSVTRQAEKKCRNVIRRALRSDKEPVVVLVGCYSQLRPDELAELGVDLVLGTNEKEQLFDYLISYVEKRNKCVVVSDTKGKLSFFPSYSLNERTRSFLKVQDGCDYFCAYCTIPHARGRSRSCYVEEAVASAKEIIAAGIGEIVITGVNIGDFGKHQHESFYDLLVALDQLPGKHQYRISSIEPDLLSSELIAFVAQSSHFAPHFHIPLQSGSSQVLQVMGRRYDTGLFDERISEIKKHMPYAGIGIDVVVGFPGETDALFNATYDYLQQLDFAYAHIFPFSERPGTKAEKMPDKVSPQEKEERVKKLLALAAEKKKVFYEKNLNKEAIAIFETIKNGYAYGYTDNYIHLRVKSDKEKPVSTGVRTRVILANEHDSETINAFITI